MESAATITHRMQCMEIWGGNQSVDSAVTLSGLNAWVYSRPQAAKDEAAKVTTGGGDVHYVSSCASGRITRLLVADVSGHGQTVSDIAQSLRDLMRRYINYVSPGKFMESMNRQFALMTDAGCFATAVVATYFATTRTLTLCNAGHPPPLIYRAAEKKWSLLEREGGARSGISELPLGVVEGTGYDAFSFKLNAGDLVLSYTDSLIEARDGQGRQIGTRGLLELVESLDVSQPDQIIAALLEKIDGLSPVNRDQDDLTALLFTPNATSVGWKNMLLAPVRIIGDWLGVARRDRQIASVT